MAKIVIEICSTLYTMRNLFGGISVIEKHPDEDFYDLDIPTPTQDRKNLADDVNAVLGDYGKAFHQKKSLDGNHNHLSACL